MGAGRSTLPAAAAATLGLQYPVEDGVFVLWLEKGKKPDDGPSPTISDIVLRVPNPKMPGLLLYYRRRCPLSEERIRIPFEVGLMDSADIKFKVLFSITQK